MERYDLLYRLYDEFDTEALRQYQDFVSLFPPVDSRVALGYWQDARDRLRDRKAAIRDAFPDGETYAEVAAHADREGAFTGLDLYTKYGRAVNALVLDVDETLRSAGKTDNEIPRETLYVISEFLERDVPVVICTGQTLENVKGFTIQGLGNELVHSGRVSIVYESGSGVFTPGHGTRTKRLLYEELDAEIRAVFDSVRSRILSEAPEVVRHGCHLQGNEFNVTLKPNFETGSDRAAAVVDAALVHLLDLLGGVVADDARGAAWARTFYASADDEIRRALEREDALADVADEDVPVDVRQTFDRIDVSYYHADAAEIGSLELNKVTGVQAALDVLGVDDPFVFVMGDSKTDLRVMRWVDDGAGIAAAPDHASATVLEHVRNRDDLVFDRGDSATMLRTIYVMNLIASL